MEKNCRSVKELQVRGKGLSTVCRIWSRRKTARPSRPGFCESRDVNTRDEIFLSIRGKELSKRKRTAGPRKGFVNRLSDLVEA